MELQELPIGEQVFETLRREGYLYIDKTELIYSMTQKGTYYFLSRPRRFGKSLLLSTIEAYFLGKRELFNGLYIANQEKDWPIHPVFHIDFSLQSYETETDLQAMLNDYLSNLENVYGASESESTIALRFKGLIRRAYEKTGKGVVILIDEYDKPLLEAIGDPERQERYRKELRGFYGILKGMNQYIRFALLTGITKFSKVSIFSDLNNLRDISMTKPFACLCGLTDEEVDRDLAPYIANYAEEKGMSYEAARELMRRMYDGYHFVADSPGLYNPFSLMNALLWKDCIGYWFESGTPTMLVEMLKRQHYPLDSIERSINTTALDNKSGSADTIIPLLYQSGYLTIDRMSPDGRTCWVKFPNDEVRDGFFNFLLPYYASVQGEDTNTAIDDFVADIRFGNVEQFLQRLQSFFADFQYDAQTTPESHFRNVLYILCKLMGLQVDAEYQTSDGRIDLLLRTDKFVYIIECKIDSTARIALDQIKSKEYALPWSLDNREKILVGINFSTKTRRPNDWVIERGKDAEMRGKDVEKRGKDQKEGKDGKKRGNVYLKIVSVVKVIQTNSLSVADIMEQLGLRGDDSFRKRYLNPAMDEGYVARLYPDKPTTKGQLYLLTDKGLALLDELTKGR